MKILRVAVLLVLVLASVGVVFADHQQEPCSPLERPHGSLYIAWIDCQNNQNEVVVIVNGTDSEIDLTDYVIESSSGQQFVFESKSINAACCLIAPYDVLRVHSGPRNASFFPDLRDLHWLLENGQPMTNPIWDDAGDSADLYDYNGHLVDTYAY